MHLLLAALGAFAVGGGDVAGGVATRRDGPHRVATLNFAVGAILAGAVAVVLGQRPDTAVDGLWAAASGAGAAVAVTFLYRGFDRAPIGIVSPVAAVVGTAIPVVAGLVLGERLGPARAVGLALAVVSIAVVSRGSATAADESLAGRGLTGVVYGLGAGVGVGLLLMALAVAQGGAIVLVAIARAVSFALLATVSIIGGQSLLAQPRSARLLTVVTGAATTAAGVLFYVAAQTGPIVEATAVFSLFPATTLIIARIVLGERLTPVQLVGVVLAVAAAVVLGVA